VLWNNGGMSNQNPFGNRGASLFPVLPKGEVLATYDTYAQAQEAVDVLAKADFPVKQLSIVGNDLKTVERVTGKLTWGRVALAGAASGAWLGIFFGLLFFIFSPTGAGLPFVLAAVLMGAGFGMLFGVVSYTLNRRRRDFTSTMQVMASSYQIIVEAALVNKARNLLTGGAEPLVVHRTEPEAAPTAPAGPEHPAPPYGQLAPPETSGEAPAAPPSATN
jgi:hypothetical protein